MNARLFVQLNGPEIQKGLSDSVNDCSRPSGCGNLDCRSSDLQHQCSCGLALSLVTSQRLASAGTTASGEERACQFVNTFNNLTASVCIEALDICGGCSDVCSALLVLEDWY